MKTKMKILRDGLILVFLVFAFIFFGSFLTGCEEDNNFRVSNPSEIVDVDGNVYHSIIIGDQEWMIENLMVTRLNDGTPIPLVVGQTKWNTMESPAYCFYNNDMEINKEIYGALYNWYAVNTGKLCPTGWHVPNDREWMELIEYCGGLDMAGIKINVGNTNDTRFSAVPAGMRGYDNFYWLGDKCSFISHEPKELGFVSVVTSYSYQSRVDYGAAGFNDGLSVRCLKNK